ncbi:molybdenum cofactor guanylyltransferase [Saccharomonospora azurea]|uniref:Molybdopterin-guanine dinucleotide biosynthesis protein A n=1 Tax=Saccharomonospora azurea NA-128 TaxID=882081 RepID=H8GCZ8_9PSEU|nr:NTP transferase domain-containing protein [Saccharomonospora azurea]EHK82956.1 molybdopterin-guanine dinucleotide biosynthesis protein A [Saccharomonospora azurea SZMC 14600]EHY87834.1 molybdopterin-guanine dinucleotide biosynthesis protein A [Saccharomonospora azurea NA-128]
MTDPRSPRPRLAGVVLAGGAARRMGGVDKAMLRVGGVPLLSRAITALGDADPVVVVGPRREGFSGVCWTREEPAGSGPVAALAAALALLDEHVDTVAVLAADLAGVTPHTITRLRSALDSPTGRADGALLVDGDGHRQWLVGVWRRRALDTAVPADPRDASLRGTLGKSSIVEVPALEGEAHDVDSPDDLRP